MGILCREVFINMCQAVLPIYTTITSVCILYTLIDGFKFTYNIIIILWKTTKRYESDGPC